MLPKSREVLPPAEEPHLRSRDGLFVVDGTKGVEADAIWGSPPALQSTVAS